MISKTITLAALVAAAGIASADVIVSYAYSDLNGSFDSASGIFTADAFDGAAFTTGGDVSRINPHAGTADFPTGFMGLATAADVRIDMMVFNITGTTADGTGTVELTDINGDVLRASFSGSWQIVNPFGFMFFNGISDDYEFINNSGDGWFDGINGSFLFADLLDTYFDGALSLLLRNPGGFGGDFADRSTQADGILIPTPGVLMIAGAGVVGMIAPRRRRR